MNDERMSKFKGWKYSYGESLEGHNWMKVM
jgi:hypothetical protein